MKIRKLVENMLKHFGKRWWRPRPGPATIVFHRFPTYFPQCLHMFTDPSCPWIARHKELGTRASQDNFGRPQPKKARNHILPFDCLVLHNDYSAQLKGPRTLLRIRPKIGDSGPQPAPKPDEAKPKMPGALPTNRHKPIPIDFGPVAR